MDTEQTEQASFNISQEKLLAVIRAIGGGDKGREDDEHPLPPGPWDPVIRIALEHISVFGPYAEPREFSDSALPWGAMGTVFGPRPEPWKAILASIIAKNPEILNALGDGQNFGDGDMLNPQPLLPRSAFFVALAQSLVSRAELLQEVADAAKHNGEQRGIIIVSGYISRFVDDFCGTDHKLRWPFPGPRPHWFTEELDGIDLVVMAGQFEQSAKETFNRDLRQNLIDASTRLAEAGLAKIR